MSNEYVTSIERFSNERLYVGLDKDFVHAQNNFTLQTFADV